MHSHDDQEKPYEPPRFPRGEIAAVAALVAVQLAMVLWAAADPLRGSQVLVAGGLRKGVTAFEPWRLITSLLLHSDVRHVLWNGVSTFVFAVPVLSMLGFKRAALVYFAAGVGGGLTAVYFADFGVTIIGSSGAVSGLFGAWVVLTLARARETDIPWRGRVRAFGIALLVLPSLVNPITASGQPVSVSSHLGGAATGMAVGALLTHLARRRTPTDPEDRFRVDEPTPPDSYLN